MKRRRILLLILIIILLTIGYGYRKMTVHRSMIGEDSFYKDENIELKVVLIHENLPLHYVGNSYSIACQSQNTKGSLPNDEAEWKFDLIEKDWNRVPDAHLGNGMGSDKNAVLRSLVAEAKKTYLVFDKMTFAFIAGTRLVVTFDGCGTFRSWALAKDLPAELLPSTTPEFEKCMELQKGFGLSAATIQGNCVPSKFSGENKPVFQDIVASSKGYAAFQVNSQVFGDRGPLTVETSDFGKTWQTVFSHPRR